MPLRKFRNLIWPGILLVLFTFQASAAVTVDSASQNGASDTIIGISSLAWPHTIGAGSSRALFVGVSTSATLLPPSAGSRVSGITYNGQNLTAIGTQVSPDLRNAVHIYRLINPPAGTANIIVSLTPGTTNYAVGGAVSFFGVSPITPNAAFASAGGNNTSPNISVTGSAAGDVVLDILGTAPNATFVSPAAGQAEQWNGRVFFSGSFDVGAGSVRSGLSPVPMSWTMTIAENWAQGGIAVKAVPTTAASVSVGGRVATGSGQGIRGARVTLTGPGGEMRVLLTNPFGYYRFDDVRAGETYVISVSAKCCQFSPRVLTITEELGDLDFSPDK